MSWGWESQGDFKLSTISPHVTVEFIKSESSVPAFKGLVRLLLLLVSLALCHVIVVAARWSNRFSKMSHLVRQAVLKVPRLLVTNNSQPHWHLQQVLRDYILATTIQSSSVAFRSAASASHRLRVFVVLSKFTCLRVGLQFGQDCSTLSCFWSYSDMSFLMWASLLCRYSQRILSWW